MSEQHSIINPVGDVLHRAVCYSIGHEWKFMQEMGPYVENYRYCDRCDRAERVEGGAWIVNKIHPGVA